MQQSLEESQYSPPFSVRPATSCMWGIDPVNSLDRITQAAEELSKGTGNTCIPAQADVRRPDALKEAVRKTVEKFGRIDFVICGESKPTCPRCLDDQELISHSIP